MPTKKKAAKSATNRAKYQVTGGQNLWASGSKSGVLVNVETALGMSAVWCAVRTISQDLACMPLRVYQEKKSGTRTIDKDHRLNGLFRNPNPEMTWPTFFECLQSHALLQTGSYAEIVRAGDGTAGELYPINPHYVQMYRDTDTGQLSYRITLSNTGGPPGSPGEQIELKASNCYHCPGLTPDGSIGYSLLTMAREVLGFGIAASQYGSSLLRNGVRPSGIIKSPSGLSDEARANLRHSYEHINAGSEKTGKLMLLEEGLEYAGMSYTNDQLQYQQLLQFMVYEVARLFTISPTKLFDLTKATWANLTELNRDYLTSTLRPWIVKHEAEMERKLLLPSEQGRVKVEFDASSLLRLDQTARFESWSKALAGKSWMVANEVRMEENLPPHDDGHSLGDKSKLSETSDETAPVQDLALNGMQISSLLLVTDKIASGDYPPEAGKAILQAAFPSMPAATVQAIVSNLAKMPETNLPEGSEKEMQAPGPEQGEKEAPTINENTEENGTSN